MSLVKGERHELGTWQTSVGQIMLEPLQREAMGSWLMS